MLDALIQFGSAIEQIGETKIKRRDSLKIIGLFATAILGVGFKSNYNEKLAYERLGQALKNVGRPDEYKARFIAMIRKESSFDNRRINPGSGAEGYMQMLKNAANDVGYTKEEISDPVKNLEMGIKYFYLNTNRYTGFLVNSGTSRSARINREQAAEYALIAHNIGPTFVTSLLVTGYGTENAEEFIESMDKRTEISRPLKWYNTFTGNNVTTEVEKLNEVIRFYKLIMGWEKEYQQKYFKTPSRNGRPVQQVSVG